MKNKLKYFPVLFLFIMLTGFTTHKFYVSIYQINYAPEKKTLQITARLFIDDLNEALHQKYGKKIFLGEKNESTADVALMKEYLAQNFSIKVNGQSKPIHFLSHELENNVIICYFTVKDATKIKSIEIKNTALFEIFPDQQHIINATVLGKKQSILLTVDQKSDVLKYE
jgi:hypothetical protein